MGRIKGWQKKKRGVWKNDRTGKTVYIVYDKQSKRSSFTSTYRTLLSTTGTSFRELDRAHSFKEARKYAVDYMRGHPNG